VFVSCCSSSVCILVLTALVQMRTSLVIILRASQKYNKRTRYGKVTSSCSSPCLTLNFVRRTYFMCASSPPPPPPISKLLVQKIIYNKTQRRQLSILNFQVFRHVMPALDYPEVGGSKTFLLSIGQYLTDTASCPGELESL